MRSEKDNQPKAGGSKARSHRSSGAKASDILGTGSAADARPERVPAQWRWHHRVLLSLRNRLLLQREESRQAIAEPLETHSMDEADSATDEFDHDLALSRLSAEQDALYELNEALHRITEGTYGICEGSGEPIPAARLKAVPWTRFTREVEELLEESGAVNRPHLGKTGTVRENGRASLEPEEEAGESTDTTANDELLPQILSPPDLGARPQKTAEPQHVAPKRKE